jgi:hypothetical protein
MEPNQEESWLLVPFLKASKRGATLVIDAKPALDGDHYK